MSDDLYQHDAPEALVESVREFIDAVRWTTAKTDKSKHPHSYVMVFSARRQGLIEGYRRMAGFIDRYGYVRRWARWEFRSVDLGGYSFWLMNPVSNDPSGTNIINRKPAEHAGWLS
jgi:hypothetical protein